MRVQVVDPSAYTPAYDHALCAALAREQADVELVTSRFGYAAAPSPEGYSLSDPFYRHAVGAPGSRLRTASKLLEHVPDMVAYRRRSAAADVVHFQWLAVQPLDRYLLPRRPTVLTAHDLLPREPRPFQTAAQRRLYEAVDAVVVHSDYGRRELVERLQIDSAKVRVIHHGAFDHLARIPGDELPAELRGARGPVVLFFGLLRPYKGIEVLLEAWRSVHGTEGEAADGLRQKAELWIVGRPRIPIDALKAAASPGVRWVTRFVSDAELAACFRSADVVVLPYLQTDRLDFSGVLATALGFGKPAVVSDVGGFGEVAQAGAARLVAPGDPAELAAALAELLGDPMRRQALAAAARTAAAGPYSWTAAARETLELYRELLRYATCAPPRRRR
jgi:glycosyltransferase involved in cell wall biosynthesis